MNHRVKRSQPGSGSRVLSGGAAVVLFLAAIPAIAPNRASAQDPKKVQFSLTTTESEVVGRINELAAELGTSTSAPDNSRRERLWTVVRYVDALLERWPQTGSRNEVLIHKLRALAELATVDESALDQLIELSTRIAESRPHGALADENAILGIRAYIYDARRKNVPLDERTEGTARRYEAFLRELPNSQYRPEIYAELIGTYLAAEETELAADALARFVDEFPGDYRAEQAQDNVLTAVVLHKPFLAEFVSDKGETISTADFKGKTLVLHFWSKDDRVSMAAISDLLQTYTTYLRYNLAMIGVSVDKDPAKAKSALASFRTPWPQCVSIKRIKSGSTDMVLRAPTYIVLDGNGICRAAGRTAPVVSVIESLYKP